MLSDPAHLLGTESCLICGAPLSHLQRVQRDRFCGERCRGKYATLPPHQICLACGHPLSPHQYGSRVCALPECQQQVEAQKRERERRRLEMLQAKAEELRDQGGRALGLQNPETYKTTVIPSSRSEITALPEHRRDAFREFVKRLIAAACAPAADPSPSGTERPRAPALPIIPVPEIHAVLNGACALCQGFCCGNGGNHAYLTVETIRRSMVEHPDQAAHGVLVAYLSCIRSETVAGSCIFHQRYGCGLPREMRSETCNRYFCRGLTEFQTGLAARGPARAFFAATEGESILAAAFCNAEGSQLVET